MGKSKNSNSTGTDDADSAVYDGSQDGTIPYWSSPGGAAPGSSASNTTGGPYAGQSSSAKSSYTPVNTDGLCDGRIGAVSAQYEASSKGAAAIGYDSTGGTSYGLYQLSSTRGSVDNFMKYLSVNDPSAYTNLNTAAANGGYGGSAFKSAWQNEAANNSKFGGEQTCYIKQAYYDVAASNIKSKYGIDVNSQPLAVQQAVWSTAVQMGPNSNVFTNAYSGLSSSSSAADQINAIYDERGKTTSSGSLSYFSSSSSSVQVSVSNRFKKERTQLLGEL